MEKPSACECWTFGRKKRALAPRDLPFACVEDNSALGNALSMLGSGRTVKRAVKHIVKRTLAHL
jgi:hypothetical protein